MVKAVLFDLFETLITESSSQPAGVSSLGSELGFESEAFRNEWKARRPDIVLGRLSLRDALMEIGAALNPKSTSKTTAWFQKSKSRKGNRVYPS